ncbi:FAD-dependent oxidoreductase [Ruminococcus sp. Marseille-P6503]|uniref:FAD-dependent oxidoreductase n=1 Tax=Ruminococcus sp. Marseille-P6503 TaxID=2364796 RepID=UPI000F51CB39|nr:FAD-dependent oxidoreductase [Ruminococcus sp. Marseille-P6503]
MKSIWSASAEPDKFPKLKQDIKTDVLIIGGGIAGILTAYRLHSQGVNCVVAEKERICGGTTCNTTAKLTSQHGFIYQKLLKSAGAEKALMYFKANQAALDEYKRLCENIECDFETKDNYVYTSDEKKLEKELSALEIIGSDAELCRRLPIPVNYSGAVKFGGQAQFNPLKFIKSISRGLNIYENTFVREMTENSAVTDSGKIYFDKAIVTTHFPFINKHGSYFLKLYQHRSYFIALENAPDVGGMYVDENKKGYSFRNYKNFLLVGGGSHRTGKKGGSWEELRNFAGIHYPGSAEKYFWAAQDCMSLDGIPYIGNYSKNTPNLYVASGFNKWGMTGAMTAAMILSDMVTEKKNEYAEVFDPSRSIIKPQLFINGFEAVTNLLTISKKRCPHLGCALKWNSAEHSWDCPCHGSRFSEKGKVLENPANGDLKNCDS